MGEVVQLHPLLSGDAVQDAERLNDLWFRFMAADEAAEQAMQDYSAFSKAYWGKYDRKELG